MTHLQKLNPQQQDLSAWLIQGSDKVSTIYATEIQKHEFSQQQIESLISLQALELTEQAHGRLTNTQLALMYFAFKEGHHVALGFEDFGEYLSSQLGEWSSNGRLSDLKALATQIIPWCEAFNLTVDGQKVDIWWFARDLDRGKRSIAVRARPSIPTLNKIILSSMPVKERLEEVGALLSVIQNPDVTGKAIADAFHSNGIVPFSWQAYADNGKVIIEMELQPDQFKYVQGRLRSATKDNDYFSKPAIVFDQGQVWLNPTALLLSGDGD